MIDWLNENQGAVMAVLTVVYVIATIVIVGSSRSAVAEQRRVREEQFRPVVIVGLEDDEERQLVFFSVENVGTVPARDVRFAVTPRFENPKNPDLSLDVPLVQDGLAVLAPGRPIRTLIFTYGDFDPKGVRHAVAVSYSSSDGRRFSEEFMLDFGAWSGLTLSGAKGVHSIAEELKLLRQKK